MAQKELAACGFARREKVIQAAGQLTATKGGACHNIERAQASMFGLQTRNIGAVTDFLAQRWIKAQGIQILPQPLAACVAKTCFPFKWSVERIKTAHKLRVRIFVDCPFLDRKKAVVTVHAFMHCSSRFAKLAMQRRDDINLKGQFGGCKRV